jgi:hypothetical protein
MSTNAKRVRIQTTELCPSRIQTTDAARRSRDGYLNPPSAEESAAQARRSYVPGMVGKILGDLFTGILDRLSPADAAKEQKIFADKLARYGSTDSSELTVNPATDRPEKVFDLSTAATGDDINGSNSLVWDRARTTDKRALSGLVARHAGGATPDDINEINRRFWAAQQGGGGR